MTNNTAESLLSEDAQREANRFQQSKRSAGTNGVASTAYIGRIQSLVIALGLVILVLGAALVYLVFKPPVTEVVIPSASEVTTAKVASGTSAIVVAKKNIASGMQITPEHLAIAERSAENYPNGAFTSSQVETLLGQYATKPILADTPITSEFISTTTTRSVPFEIPAGHRATTIRIDGRTGVEGFAKPGTFVDVLWYYSEENGRKRVVTLVPRAKVLSVGGTTEGQTPTDKEKQQASGSTATILVTKKQAHSIELARNLGVLSLSLVGDIDEEPGNADLEVTVSDILRPSETQGPSVDGVVISSNPVTGRSEKFVLKNRDWVDGQQQEGTELMRARFRRRFSNQAPTTSSRQRGTATQSASSQTR